MLAAATKFLFYYIGTGVKLQEYRSNNKKTNQLAKALTALGQIKKQESKTLSCFSYKKTGITPPR
jgi:hypothetical protein